MIARVLVLLVVLGAGAAQAADPDTTTPLVLDVQRADVVPVNGTPAGGPRVQVVGGCWLSTQQCVDTGKELADLRAQNASLRSDLPKYIAAALLGGAAAALAIERAF